MWADTVELVANGIITKDAYGNETETLTTTTVFCDVLSVGRTEFYGAGAGGHKPSKVFRIRAFEYNAEERLYYNSVLYNVIRTYQTHNSGYVDLTCEAYTSTIPHWTGS